MSRLIILSNRVSLPQAGKPTAGGLAVAMQDALSKVGGVWLGWNGEKVKDAKDQHFKILFKSKITYITCPLTQKEYSEYYSGFANNTLWPAMHERADLVEYSGQEYQTYQDVNRLFAKKLAEIAEPDDLIWVQDYHFLSVARYCREFGMTNKIGFFLHIPFAKLNLWSKIPTAKALVRDLCHFNLVGLQTQEDQRVCMNVCTTLLKAQKINNSLVSFEKNLTAIKSYPIGINVEAIQHAADLAMQKVNSQQTSDEPADLQSAVKTIIGVDRIDYSKGLLERFGAFAQYLEQKPEMQGKVQHLQIACPCRLEVPAYKRLFERFKIKTDLINNEFKKEDWYPIECHYDAVDHNKLMQTYRKADVCWVSSLKDGMNLVAKEYIAAQDPNDPGVLILSKYAGAAEQMLDALIVDPSDSAAMSNALDTALNMSKEERQYRYQRLMAGLSGYGINEWRNDFLSDLRRPHLIHGFEYGKSVNTWQSTKVFFDPSHLYRS